MKYKSVWESLERERKRKAKAKFLKALRKDPTLIYGVLVMFEKPPHDDLTKVDPEDINGIFLTLAKLKDREGVKEAVIGIGIGKHQIEISFEELIELIEEAYQDKITNILRRPPE